MLGTKLNRQGDRISMWTHRHQRNEHDNWVYGGSETCFDCESLSIAISEAIYVTYSRTNLMTLSYWLGNRNIIIHLIIQVIKVDVGNLETCGATGYWWAGQMDNSGSHMSVNISNVLTLLGNRYPTSWHGKHFLVLSGYAPKYQYGRDKHPGMYWLKIQPPGACPNATHIGQQITGLN